MPLNDADKMPETSFRHVRPLGIIIIIIRQSSAVFFAIRLETRIVR